MSANEVPVAQIQSRGVSDGEGNVRVTDESQQQSTATNTADCEDPRHNNAPQQSLQAHIRDGDDVDMTQPPIVINTVRSNIPVPKPAGFVPSNYAGPLPTSQPSSTAVLHRRGVSWDTGNKVVNNIDPLSSIHSLRLRDLQQPEFSPPRLDDVHPRDAGLTADVASLLENAIHPLETEAHAYILRAVEHKDPMHRRTGTETSYNVLGNISDDGIRSLSDEYGGTSELFLKSLRSAGVEKPPRHPRKTVKQKENLEETLFGLAMAVETIHADSDSSLKYDGELFDNDQPTLGSGDALLKNASLLYRRKQQRKAANNTSTLDDDSGHIKPSLEIFKIVVLKDSKKTDSDEADEGQDDELECQQKGPKLPATAISNSKQKICMGDSKMMMHLDEFLGPIQGALRLYLRTLLCLILLSTGISAIVFYLAGNPSVGIITNGGQPINGTLYNQYGEVVDPYFASPTWWLLYLGVRQPITFTMALGFERLLVDYLSIRRQTTFRLFGAWPTLLLLQSRGWPFILFLWSLLDYLLLAGEHPFFSHWLFWQTPIGLCNSQNPSGLVVDSPWNFLVLNIAMCVSAVTAVKRFWLGLFLGRQTYNQYSERLANVMKRILLISPVAALAKDIELELTKSARGKGRSPTNLPNVMSDEGLEGLLIGTDEASFASAYVRSPSDNDDVSVHVIDSADRHPLTGTLSANQKARISDILGQWEEPVLAEQMVELVSVSGLLQFRRALACLQTDFPFSVCFGPAGTREETVVSSQEIYARLLLRNDDAKSLDFNVIAFLCVLPDGSLDQQKLKDLIKIFRPGRDGKLLLLDFVKSIDEVYREIRMLRASVANSMKIDKAFENMLNVLYYFIVFVVLVLVLGWNPLAIMASISGILVGFAFMIGQASSQWFEGILFVLIRRPYAIGDGIHVSDPNTDTEFTGSRWWLVEDVTLFTTSVVFMVTNERATLSNGSLARSRIINSSRSPNANLTVFLKFPINVPYKKLEIFQKAVDEYIRNRPREWLGSPRFRATTVEAALGYVEYMVGVNHRESWAQWGVIRNSQAQLSQFCLELSKQLDIHYRSPPLPVNLNMESAKAQSAAAIMNSLGDATSNSGPQGSPVSALSATPRAAHEEHRSSTAAYSPIVRRLQEEWAPRS